MLTPNSNREASTLVDYSYTSNTDVHEYTFFEGSRKAVDEWNGLLHHACQHVSDTAHPGRHSSANQPPSSCAFLKAKELTKHYPDVPPQRVAIIGTLAVMPASLKPFIRLLCSSLNFNYL